MTDSPHEAPGIVVFGSLNADLTVRVDRFPQAGETLNGSELVTAPGGKSSNQAVAAAILGSRVSLVGAVGEDAHGTLLLRRARESGVDISAVQQDPRCATGSALIVVNAEGENTIIVSPGANALHTAASADRVNVSNAAVLCLCLEVPLPAVEAVAERGKASGMLVLLNLSPYAEVPAAVLRGTDVLVVNEQEARQLLNGGDSGNRAGEAIGGSARDWDATLDALVERGIPRAVLTLGPGGAVVLDDTAPPGDRVTRLAAPTVDAVDTTGCGDAFTGALAHAMATGLSLAQSAELAVRVGALAATGEGAQASYRAFAHLR